MLVVTGKSRRCGMAPAHIPVEILVLAGGATLTAPLEDTLGTRILWRCQPVLGSLLD